MYFKIYSPGGIDRLAECLADLSLAVTLTPTGPCEAITADVTCFAMLEAARQVRARMGNGYHPHIIAPTQMDDVEYEAVCSLTPTGTALHLSVRGPLGGVNFVLKDWGGEIPGPVLSSEFYLMRPHTQGSEARLTPPKHEADALMKMCEAGRDDEVVAYLIGTYRHNPWWGPGPATPPGELPPEGAQFVVKGDDPLTEHFSILPDMGVAGPSGLNQGLAAILEGVSPEWLGPGSDVLIAKPKVSPPPRGVASVMIDREYRQTASPFDAGKVIGVEVADWRGFGFGFEEITLYHFLADYRPDFRAAWTTTPGAPRIDIYRLPGPLPLRADAATLVEALRLHQFERPHDLASFIQRARRLAAFDYGIAGGGGAGPVLDMAAASRLAAEYYYENTDRREAPFSAIFDGHWTFEFGSKSGAPYRRVRVEVSGRTYET